MAGNVEIVCQNIEFRMGAIVEIRIKHLSASNNSEILYVEILIPWQFNIIDDYGIRNAILLLCYLYVRYYYYSTYYILLKKFTK